LKSASTSTKAIGTMVRAEPTTMRTARRTGSGFQGLSPAAASTFWTNHGSRLQFYSCLWIRIFMFLNLVFDANTII